MQRLFSTFPNSLPGLGLLNLRALAATCLVLHRPILSALNLDLLSGNVVGSACRIVATLGAVLLLLGLLTPLVATLLLVFEVSQIIYGTPFTADHAIQAAIALSIAVLGPGAWSIDAHRYGRKRIEIERQSDGPRVT